MTDYTLAQGVSILNDCGGAKATRKPDGTFDFVWEGGNMVMLENVHIELLRQGLFSINGDVIRIGPYVLDVIEWPSEENGYSCVCKRRWGDE